MKKSIFCLSLSLAVIQLFGQAENPRTENRNGISLYAIGPNMIGSISYDYFITPNLNAEFGIGFIGVHTGLKMHFGGNNNTKLWTPYVGASVAYALFPSVGVDYIGYFPLGIQYVGNNKLNFAFEVAPLQLKFLLWNVVGLKLGYRF